MGRFIILPIIGILISQTICAFSYDTFANNEDDCSSNTFKCTNGRCIPLEKQCDGVNDCADGADEMNCDMHHCLSPNWFKCKDHACIASSFRCDDEIDCMDASDEADCEGFVYTHPLNTTCKSDEWKCRDNICIPIEFVCNEQVDCMDGSDESIGCIELPFCDGFKCKQGKCIELDWVCDGAFDCPDQSDEINCDDRPVNFMCTFEHDHYPCHDNFSCIPLTKVCDGIPHCKDGSDEGPQCNSTVTTCANTTCGHAKSTCAMTPAGAKCICPKGFHKPFSTQMNIYSTYDNMVECIDDDECEIYGICSHKCINTHGSYKCECADKYQLQSDGHSCKVKYGEALMLFSAKTNIRSLYLESKILTEVAGKLKQVIGVSYDGNHVYWTNVYLESESIVRSREDGSQKEIIITSGLSAPEDLEVDWYTGNIYFSDGDLKHIGVCTNDGNHCTVLLNEDIEKPRGIALHPAEGRMYWSDWGTKAQIATSFMDGSNATTFVDSNVHWPNGVDLDVANNRLYWVDAKLQTVESIKLDGTDRRVVLKGASKHPFAISVFENNIYWSDLRSMSIQSCNKFNCKNRVTIAKEKKEIIYGVHIYHSALQPKRMNPCENARCTHICLLKGPDNYSCGCPEDHTLMLDTFSCSVTKKKMELLIGAGSYLVSFTHQTLGKHSLFGAHFRLNIDEMTYDSVLGRVIIADNIQKKILAIDLISNGLSEIVSFVGKVEAMDFDPYGNNLYWADSLRKSVEILNFNTNERGLILHDIGDDIPIGLALIPIEGVMFVAFRSHNYSHIDRMHMDGVGGRTHVVERSLSFLGKIKLIYDKDLHRVFWADQDLDAIESTSVDGDDRITFRDLLFGSNPVGLAILRNDIFWTERNSRKIFWGDKFNDRTLNKKLTLDIDSDLHNIPIVAVTGIFTYPHPCRYGNGNCSHMCIPFKHNMRTCLCPPGLTFVDSLDNSTCVKITRCNADQFKCRKSSTCIPLSQRCNDRIDCEDGEDEINCEAFLKRRQLCEPSQFKCKDGTCIENNLRCDLNFNCPDNSDEEDCDKLDQDSKCRHFQFQCDDGTCIDSRMTCDHSADCIDGSDERHCESVKCSTNMFQCLSGTCLPGSWECDEEIDCVDGSDEHSGCQRKKCLPLQYQCTNGRCIDSTLKCDQNDDCGDSSDEINCSNRKDHDEKPKPIICDDDMFLCEESKNKTCLPGEVRCNGSAECEHGEDEHYCNTCQHNEFTCRNLQKCIPKAWVCDHTNDCGDNSDEEPETCSKNATSLHVNHPYFHHNDDRCLDGFRCKDGKCIDLNVICNTQEDCPDGSDEFGACNVPCSSVQCGQECRPTPTGPQCYCHKGYELAGDHLHCTDINECLQETSPCSQICTNKAGSYQCGCNDGYVLRANKMSCKAVGTSMSIYYTSQNQIRKISQSPPSLSVIYSESSPQISGIDISVAKNSLYYSIETTGQIYSQNLQTQARDSVSNIGKPSKIAIDWITENIYFVDNDHNVKSLKVCHMNTQKCVTIRTFEKHEQITALAIDPVNRFIFYTITEWFVYNNPTSTIYKANLDASKITNILHKNLHLVSGLSPDYNKKILYFCDTGRDILETIDYDGNNRQVVIEKNSLLRKPKHLVIFEDYAYMIKSGSSKMIKCKLFENKVCTDFELFIQDSDSFTISQQSRQYQTKNVCENVNCSLLCVPADLGPKCLCHGGKMAAEGEECSNIIGLALNPVFYSDQDDGSSVTRNWFIALAILVSVLGIIAGVSYYRKKRFTANFNIGNIRFQNPVFGIRGMPEECGNVLETLRPGQSEYVNPSEANLVSSYSYRVPHDSRGLTNPEVMVDNDSDIECDQEFNDADYNPRTYLISID